MDKIEYLIDKQTSCPKGLISLEEWLDTPVTNDKTVRDQLTLHANRLGYFSEEDLLNYFERIFYEN